MCARKRTLMLFGLIVLALLASSVGPGGAARPAAAQVDWCKEIQQDFEALNRGEIHLESFADDVVFYAMPICDQVKCVGKDAFRNNLEHYVDQNARWTMTSCEVSGDTVETTYEFAYDVTRAAGVDRAIGETNYEFQDDKIVLVRNLIPNVADPQTARLVGYWMATPAPTFEMGPGRDADQSPGMAEMHGFPGFVSVFVRIAPGPAGVPQPIHIHEGTCANLGAVAFDLRNVDGGVSHTILRDATLSDLQTGNYAIAVQQSQDELDVLVACADIPGAAAAVPPAEPAPAAQEAPAIAPVPAAGLPSAGSGGLLTERGSGAPVWWYALAGGGALLLLAGLAGVVITRGRR